jgi:spore coat protein U-like protein
MNKLKQLAAICASVALAFGVGNVYAGSDTGSLTVDATVIASCTVGDAALDAGDINPTTGSAIDFATTFNLTCTAGTSADLAIDAGAGTGATVATRKMSGSGSNTLNYTIYSNPGRTTVWGETSGTDTVAVTGSGLNQPQTLYGRIAAAQQTAPVDSYHDDLTITVTF